MKKTFTIISAETAVKNERVTVVNVVIEDVVTQAQYKATGRAFLNAGDVDNPEFGFYLAKARAVEKAVKKIKADRLVIKQAEERYAAEAAELYDRATADVESAKRLVTSLLNAEANGQTDFGKHSAKRPNEAPSLD